MKRYIVAIVVLLLITNRGFAQFTLSANVPSSTNICYASGNFNAWSITATPMDFASNNTDGTKTFTVNLPLIFLNTGTFKILSGPAWTYGQADPQFTAAISGISQSVSVLNFLAIYIPVVVNPLSANNTIYIGASQNSYSFVNNDFAFYEANSSSLAGVIITSIPSGGILFYNSIPLTQTDVTNATVFTDRTLFSFTPDGKQTASTFKFKLKDSKGVFSQPYSFSIKYNIPVSKLVRTSRTNYIEANGLPYLLYGIQLRIDDYLGSYPYNDATKLANVYQYFQKANLAGFKDVLVPIPWNYIETADSTFNFSLIDSYLANANTYNLKLQFLWFGSDVCGWSNVPVYISNDKTTYPLISSVSGAPLNLGTSKLIEKETRAVNTLMNYLAQKDVNKRVVMMQVENEPDHIGSTTTMWAGGQKTAGYHMLDTLGQVIHASDADMITRVNLAGYTNDASDFGSLKGINIVGRDFYTDALSGFQTGSGYFGYPWNVNYTPENGGQYKNMINLALAAFSKGAGYMNYELRTTGWRASQYDLGMYRSTAGNDWIQRDGTKTVAYSLTNTNLQTEVNMNEVQNFNTMIYKADKKIAKAPESKVAAFNLSDNQFAVNETKSFSTYTITYTSAVGGEAIAFEDDNGDIILMSLKDNSSFTFQSLPQEFHISIGYFDDLNVWHQNSTRSITGNNVTLNATEVALLTATVYPDNISETPDVKSNNQVTIYPNPNQGQFNLKIGSLDFTPKLMEVYNLNSQLVYTQDLIRNENNFDIRSIKKGLYLLKLSGINADKIFINKLLIN